MAERLIFCVDGGGTGSRARLVTEGGAAIAAAEAGPCNPTSDLDGAVASVAALWSQVSAAAGGTRPEDHLMAIGAAGIVSPPVRRAFHSALPAFAETHLMSDGYAALVGAGAGRPCGLVILGTGAVAHRLMANGTSLQRDGWGWVGGDRGSAAWIGRSAVRLTLEARDGLRDATTLTQWVEKVLGASEAAILDWLQQAGPRRLASLAPLVTDSAAVGDGLAASILDRAAEHAALLAASLELAANDPLYLAGGVAEIQRSRIEARLGRSFDAPQGDALDGCWRVATGQAPPECRR
ncbi:MAG TPA: BadF/BadG/BcrA/BcrD ATPase family protein [Afifellaceae bacterium]|nr:BadF/BadG/BcrA/BcrD ATPase family protein [Afifellaceae bacterium]